MGRSTVRSMVAVVVVMVVSAGASVALVADTTAVAAPGEQRSSTENPDLDAACGIDIHVILDESSSIDQYGATEDVRRAFRAFAGSLRNTGSRLAVSEMGTQARLPLGGASGGAYTVVTDSTIATTFEPYISTGYAPPPIGIGTQYTNWEDAMRLGRFALPRPRADVPHLVIFITDGDATAVIRQDQVSGVQYETQFPLLTSQIRTGQNSDVALAPAIPNANAMKAQGSHILVVGVGRALTNDDSLARLVAVSGPNVYPDDGPFDIAATDVYREADFSRLEDALREAAFQLCAPSVNIRKQLDLNPDPAVEDLVPGQGWDIEAEVAPAPATWVLPAGATGSAASVTTGPDGFANLQWTTSAPTDSAITVSEVAQAGFSYDPTATTCSFITPDDPVPRPLPDLVVTADGFDATVPDEAIVTCDLVNRLVPAPAVALEKYTNGADADEPPGIPIPVGEEVTWTYRVTNTGNVPLTDIDVVDDQVVAVSCPGTPLGVGEDLTCTATGVAVAGQYANVGSVTAVGAGTTVTDTDPSHHHGAIGGIAIQKSTNGDPATEVPGPYVPVGDPVTWTYEVQNPGTTTVDDIVVTDDRIGVVACPSTSLAPSASMTCTASGIATAGQYENVATVTGVDELGTAVDDADVSHHFGIVPGLSLVKTVNGEDANTPTGPLVAAGDAVTFRFQVTNTGNVPLTWTIDDPDTPPVACPRIVLLPGTSTTCFAATTATVGQHLNTATATGFAPNGSTATDTDPAHYYGVAGAVAIDKFVEGDDADDAPGPVLPVGAAVTWTYVVTNTGNVDLTDVVVVDTRDATVSCPATALAVGDDMTCTATGTVVAGQHTNEGVVTALTPLGLVVQDEDPAHHFGGEPGIHVEKLTDGLADLDAPPGVLLDVGGPVVWTFVMRNTGNLALTDVSASDDQLGPLDCPASTLAVGASMTCTATGTVAAGQYANRVTATGVDSEGATVTDEDDSHHFGAVRAIELRKLVNGEDADTAPGLDIPQGEPVVMSFEVSNPGNLALIDVELADDLGHVPQFVGGDLDGDDELDPGEVWVYEVALGAAVPGRYDNLGTVTATDGLENEVTDSDPAFAGTVQLAGPGLGIRKEAVRSPIAPGDLAEFRITVDNTGDVDLTGVTVSDSRVPACDRVIGDLPVGGSVSYTCAVRLAGTMVNVAVVSGEGATGSARADDSATVTVRGTVLPTTGGDPIGLVRLGLVMAGVGTALAAVGRVRSRTAVRGA